MLRKAERQLDVILALRLSSASQHRQLAIAAQAQNQQSLPLLAEDKKPRDRRLAQDCTCNDGATQISCPWHIQFIEHGPGAAGDVYAAPCVLQAEDSVLSFLRQQNRPYNAQGVTDHLAQFGVKKAQAQRALDALVESSKITCKASPDALPSLQIKLL